MKLMAYSGAFPLVRRYRASAKGERGMLLHAPVKKQNVLYQRHCPKGLNVVLKTLSSDTSMTFA